jgi:sortase A
VFASLVVMILGGLYVFGVAPFSNASSETEVVQRSEPPTVAQAPEAAANVKAEEEETPKAEEAGEEAPEAAEAGEEAADKPATIAVPDIPYNATEEEAKEMLEKNNLELGEVKREPNDDYDKGGVFWQDPLPDVEVKEGSEVGITLSSGPPPESENEEDPRDPATSELYLTVPKMGLSGDPVANATDPGTLMNGAGKITETGFPWEPNANTYIASHVYGYEGTGSWQHFAALPTMTYGDEVILSDANGTEYVYEVTNILTVAPTDVWVTEPVEGKDMVSLQTCVGPGWSERMVVQAERVDVEGA